MVCPVQSCGPNCIRHRPGPDSDGAGVSEVAISCGDPQSDRLIRMKGDVRDANGGELPSCPLPPRSGLRLGCARPPAGAQAHHSPGTPGRSTTRFRRPLPPRPVGPTALHIARSGSFRLRKRKFFGWRRLRLPRNDQAVRALGFDACPWCVHAGFGKGEPTLEGLQSLAAFSFTVRPGGVKCLSTLSTGTAGFRMGWLQCTVCLARQGRRHDNQSPRSADQWEARRRGGASGACFNPGFPPLGRPFEQGKP